MLKFDSNTSVSDDGEYPNFCMKASIEQETFDNFKQCPVYTKVLEHVDYETGKKYLDELFKDNPIFLEKACLDKFKENDNYGNPTLFDYDKVKQISGSTLRYMKILSDLKKYFVSLDDKNICEIGVGYGGQCKIILGYFSPNSYLLVDIKQVLCLVRKYLDNFSLKNIIDYKTSDVLIEKKYDLVISNYAFSEIRREYQEIYLKKIILNSTSGYMICNQITPEEFNSFSKEELLKIIPNNPIIIDEVPLTGTGNYVIIWGSNNKN